MFIYCACGISAGFSYTEARSWQPGRWRQLNYETITQPEQIDKCRDEVPAEPELAQEYQVDCQQGYQGQVQQQAQAVGWQQLEIGTQVPEHSVEEQQSEETHDYQHEYGEGGWWVDPLLRGIGPDDILQLVVDGRVARGNFILGDRVLEAGSDSGDSVSDASGQILVGYDQLQPVDI